MYKVDVSKIKFWWSSCDWAPCTQRLEAIHLDWPYPIAFVIISQYGLNSKGGAKSLMNILYTWCDPRVRRQGLMTAMHKEIEKNANVILSGASSNAGAKFMKKNGYKNDRNLWIKHC